MPHFRLYLYFLLFLSCSNITGQILTFNNITEDELSDIIRECNTIDWSKPQQLDNYLYCAAAYSEGFNQQRAIKINESAKAYYPYNVEVRLQQSILLNSIDARQRAEQNLIGLIRLYPKRAKLHNVIARINYPDNRVKAALGFMMNLALSPNNQHARENKAYLKMLLHPGKLKISRKNKSPQKSKDINVVGLDNFSQAEYVLENTAHSTMNEHHLILTRLKVLIIALDKTSSAKQGFFWDNYVPFFIDLYKQDLLETYVHYIYQSKDESKQWLLSNPTKVKQYLKYKKSINFNK